MTTEKEKPAGLTSASFQGLLFTQLLTATNDNIFRWLAIGIGKQHAPDHVSEILMAEHDGDFYKFVRARDLIKNEGLVLRHLLRLVILAGEFHAQSGGDPDYELIRDAAMRVCQQVDANYTDRFLASQDEAAKLLRRAKLTAL